MCLTKKITVLSMFLVVGLLHGNAVSASNDSIDRLDEHWQMILNESDEKRRLEMMNEHEKMMVDVMQGSEGIMGGHHGGQGSHHMMNKLEMHRSTMDMMK